MNLIGQHVKIYPHPQYQVADDDDWRSNMKISMGPEYRGRIVAFENGSYKIEYCIGLAIHTFGSVNPHDDDQCKLLTTGE